MILDGPVLFPYHKTMPAGRLVPIGEKGLMASIAKSTLYRVDFCFLAKMLKKCFSRPSICRMIIFMILTISRRDDPPKLSIGTTITPYAANLGAMENFILFMGDGYAFILKYAFDVG